jgi:hypothetical protein
MSVKTGTESLRIELPRHNRTDPTDSVDCSAMISEVGRNWNDMAGKKWSQLPRVVDDYVCVCFLQSSNSNSPQRAPGASIVSSASERDSIARFIGSIQCEYARNSPKTMFAGADRISASYLRLLIAVDGEGQTAGYDADSRKYL